MRPVRNYETEVREAYICYLHDLVTPDSSPDLSLNKLFHCLYSIQFTWSNPFDANRAEDGLWLRYRFSTESPYADAEQVLTEPCTVLEMMVGLANRMSITGKLFPSMLICVTMIFVQKTATLFILHGVFSPILTPRSTNLLPATIRLSK